MKFKRKVGLFDYETVSHLTGKSSTAIYQDASRGNIDLEDLASVVIYVARHAIPEIKAQIMASMTERDLDLSVYTKKRKAFMKKRRSQRSSEAEKRNRTAKKHRQKE